MLPSVVEVYRQQLGRKGAKDKMEQRLIAQRLATAIKREIDTKSDKRINHATLATSYALHVALEAIATELEVDKVWFKRECGVGQPLAYFI
jgi:hypothetical protein